MSATTSTSFFSSSSCLRLQPQRLSTILLSFDCPNIIEPHNIKTHMSSFHTFLSHHSPQFTASATALDSFEDSQSEEEFDEDEGLEEEAPVGAEGSRLYVGNLPYAMTSSELTEIFSEAGRVTSVEIVYDRVTDRSRGFAFVTMQTVDEAKDAIRMFSGALVGGRSVKVNFPEVPRGGEREVLGPKIRSSYRGFIDSSYKIYAGNLSWNITSQGLRDAFEDQPGLLSAKVIYERDSGRSRGFGFITFASMNEAQSALEAMNGVELDGRPLRLNLAVASASASDAQLPDTKSETETNDSGNAMQSTIAMN
ncbi:33 kDa ribonucleoprotein [Thalictrum thalictroides]|uniref:33 kDa ribonucleoprotein n=1 Tax=Thalictrum thalictroides TaxID=46969 RepID=A0A7J6UY18_THATH|nr:33 kDa ribonucleoprotein [Thalictrum thalictroides]